MAETFIYLLKQVNEILFDYLFLSRLIVFWKEEDYQEMQHTFHVYIVMSTMFGWNILFIHIASLVSRNCSTWSSVISSSAKHQCNWQEKNRSTFYDTMTLVLQYLFVKTVYTIPLRKNMRWVLCIVVEACTIVLEIPLHKELMFGRLKTSGIE